MSARLTPSASRPGQNGPRGTHRLLATTALAVLFGSGLALAQQTGSTSPTSTVTVRASGTPLQGVWPSVDLRVNGVKVKGFAVDSRTARDYSFAVPAIPSGARVDVVFTNDRHIPRVEDRNLLVDSITIDGQTIAPNATGVTLDRGAGTRAFDGIDVIPGQRGVYWNGALRFTAPQVAVVTPPPPVVAKPAIGSFVERVVNADGTIDWAEWTKVAQTYHTADVINYRLGPGYSDFNPGPAANFPTIFQPEPNGLWKGGVDKALADRLCVTSDKLPRSEFEESQIQDGGGGWQMSGQLLFAPDANAPADFKAGSANTRAFDGAMARKLVNGELVTKALCMRMNASWFGDWWNRNNISTPTTPAVTRVLQAYPNTPLPAIATTRGQIQSSITGFVAFQNGVIAAAGTGNDQYCNGFGTGTACETLIKLPDGKVPTALALTGMNEFLFATVWDVNARKGQLAVIAVGPDDPANVGITDTGRHGWGAQSWPGIRALKLLGFVDLPMAAPTMLSAAINTGSLKFRGFDTWRGGELLTQAGRDEWNARSIAPLDSWWQLDETKWQYFANAGYAVVGSRAENKVAIIDLKPLLNFYREMYLTTEARWNQTANSNQGPGDNQWPYTFTARPEQMPKVLGTLAIDKPTAVFAWQRRGGTNTLAGWDNNDWNALGKMVTIGSMDGTVRQYDVSTLIQPDPKVASVMPTTPVRSWNVGRNPVQITAPIAGATRTDDLYIVSRGTREIAVHSYKGAFHGVLKDSRLQDPVALTIGPNGAGYGGSGAGYALGAQTLTVLDHNGKTVHVYGMYVDNYAARYQPGRLDSWVTEQWPFKGPNGESQQFQYGSGRTLPGKPFAYTIDEVI